MKQEQSNFLNMARAIGDLFASNSDLWKNKPLIVKIIEQMAVLMDRIKAEAVSQEQNQTVGYTAEKERVRILLEESLWMLAGRLNVYAQETGNDVAAAQMSLSRTGLGRMSINNLLIKARVIIEKAWSMQPVPEEYEVSVESVDALVALVATTEELNSHRDAVQGVRSGNTALLKSLFSELRAEMKKLDNRVDAYIDNPEFRSVYTFTRRIRDTRSGGSRKKEADKPVQQPGIPAE